MSVLPILLNLASGRTDATEYGTFADFGLGIYPHEIRRVHRCPRLYSTYPRRRRCPYTVERRKSSGNLKTMNDLSVGKDGFQVCMDVEQFRPNELTVKMVDNTVIVEGKHEEREDEDGLISRHFVRKYSLPKGYDPKEVVSTLSSDGILTVRAPPPSGKKKGSERIIQIQETGPAHLSVKENPKEGDKQDGDSIKGGKISE